MCWSWSTFAFSSSVSRSNFKTATLARLVLDVQPATMELVVPSMVLEIVFLRDIALGAAWTCIDKASGVCGMFSSTAVRAKFF